MTCLLIGTVYLSPVVAEWYTQLFFISLRAPLLVERESPSLRNEGPTVLPEQWFLGYQIGPLPCFGLAVNGRPLTVAGWSPVAKPSLVANPSAVADPSMVDTKEPLVFTGTETTSEKLPLH